MMLAPYPRERKMDILFVLDVQLVCSTPVGSYIAFCVEIDELLSRRKRGARSGKALGWIGNRPIFYFAMKVVIVFVPRAWAHTNTTYSPIYNCRMFDFVPKKHKEERKGTGNVRP